MIESASGTPQLLVADKRQLAIAREIQAALLPKTCAGCQGISLAVRRLPEGGVGGDFHEFAIDADGRDSLIIGDVAGHGIDSALVMALVIGVIRALGPRVRSPLIVMGQVNSLLCQLNDRLQGRAITCSLFFGIVDRETQTFQFCNAGHPCPLVRTKSGKILKLQSNSGLLGVSPDLKCDGLSVKLRSLDRAVFYTDGITEAHSPSGEGFGVDRLQRVFESTASLPVERQVDAVLQAVRRHVGTEETLQDDATAIVADFAVVAEAAHDGTSGSASVASEPEQHPDVVDGDQE